MEKVWMNGLVTVCDRRLFIEIQLQVNS